jgi:hypothetical protein
MWAWGAPPGGDKVARHAGTLGGEITIKKSRTESRSLKFNTGLYNDKPASVAAVTRRRRRRRDVQDEDVACRRTAGKENDDERRILIMLRNLLINVRTVMKRNSN